MDKLLKKDNLILLDGSFEKDYKLYLFRPNVIKLFPKSGNMHEMNLKQRIRFLCLLIHGYRVYVMGDREDNVVGCAVFSNGKTFRYPFATERDLICGPYYIMPEFRRRGLATKLLDRVMDEYETEYDSIYAHIWYENLASINCMEKLGFRKIGNLTASKFTSKCISDENGNLVLVKKDNPERTGK